MLKDDVQLSIEVGIDLFRDLIFASWKAATGWTKKEFPDPFGTATKNYIGGIIERYNLVKVLGMREPVPLKDILVRANILEELTAQLSLRADHMNDSVDFDRRGFGKTRETVDGEIIVNRLQKFIVLGKPGAGKTTYLKFLTLMMLDPTSQIKQRRLPIFVILREWADELTKDKQSLMSFIINQFDICGFEQADLFVEKMLRDGECLVLFDGLDEVSSDANQDDIIRQIRNFTDKYSDNQFIISCRVAAYNHWFERFTDVEMADFNEAQMETFIRNWFHDEPKVADECWARLKNSPPLRELASVPLLLTLLCLTYNPEKGFPQKRSDIYRQTARQLLEDWDEKRPYGRVKRESVYKDLSVELKELMLAEIAWRTFNHDLYFVEEDKLTRMIEVFLKQQPEFANTPRISGRKVLKEIEAHHSILVERASGVYSFAHLTFQEYFTARYIVDNQFNGSLEKLVEEHLYDSKWKEVFLLVAGMVDCADELLLLMWRKANEALEVPEINELFRAAKESLLENAPHQLVLIRGIAVLLGHRGGDAYLSDLLHLGGYFHRINLNNLHGLVSPFRNATSWEKIIPSDIHSRPEFQEQFKKIGIDLRVIEAFIASTPNYSTNLDSYAYTNLLILNCLYSGCYISKPIREKLLHEMFLPKEDLGPGGGQ